MSSKRTGVQVHLVRLAGEDDCFAFVTHEIDTPAFLLALEYYLLRRIVHAGLADVVRGIGILIRLDVLKDKRSWVQLAQIVLSPLMLPLRKLSDLCCQLSFFVFERLDLILHRRHLLLRLERGVLDVEDPFLHRLQRIGELRIVACSDRGFGEIEKCFHAAQGSTE